MRTNKEKIKEIVDLGFEYWDERKDLTLWERILLLWDKILIYIKWRNATGALLEKEDARNVPATVVLEKEDILVPKVYVNNKAREIAKKRFYNQKRLGVCVATAQTMQMELLYPEVDFSVRFAYKMAKKLDGYNGEGTWGAVMAKVHKDYGAATVNTIPDNFDLSYNDYINFEPTEEALKEAGVYKIAGYVFANTIDEIKKLILKYGSVTTTVWAKAMWNATGYHRIELIDWDENGFYAINSWGNQEPVFVPYNVELNTNIAYVKSDDDKKKIVNYRNNNKEWPWPNFTENEFKKAGVMDTETRDWLQKIRTTIGMPLYINKYKNGTVRASFYKKM